MGVGGTTQFVTSRGGYRYVRITLAIDNSPAGRAIILAHELQHACEVATSKADDVPSVRQLFEKEGHRIGEYFETRSAMNIERLARKELDAAARALQTEPVIKFDH
jgi:hypothetical protein